MPEVSHYGPNLEQAAPLALEESVFGAEVREHLLHDTVRMQLAGRRSGTASTKTRSEVSGGGAKPWKQKGTGRARAGSRRSPLWRGGGTIFGPKPRDYGYRIPRSARRQALCTALSLRAQEGKLVVVDDFGLEEMKTRVLAERLERIGAPRALIVHGSADPVLERSARNLKHVKTVRADGVNVYDILRFEHLVLTRDALEAITERLK